MLFFYMQIGAANQGWSAQAALPFAGFKTSGFKRSCHEF